MKNKSEYSSSKTVKPINPPNLTSIEKIGIVSRDYRKKDKNKFRDFSYTFENILLYLNQQGCDSVIFSLFTIVKRKSFDVLQTLNNMKMNNIKAIFIEEFLDVNNEREAGEYVIYFKDNNIWKEYRLIQKFGTLEYTKSFENMVIEPFKVEVKTQRLLGNCTILLCGETNIVKYSKASKKIEDRFNFLRVLNKDIKIILNPIHDRMTRFEMKLKRQYLSKNKRWVVSVWNKGKSDKNGKIKDGEKPAWTIYYDGKEKDIKPIVCGISNQVNMEIGILDLNNV
jgi:hypothetical protein